MPDPDKKIGPLLVGDRPLPAAVDAERAVLSCLLQDADRTLDRSLGRLKTDDCFYTPAHRRLFAAFREMREENIPGAQIDLITLTERLERKGALAEVGGVEYLTQLLGIVPTVANLDRYLECVLETYLLRRLISSCSDIVGRCFEAEENVDELVDSVQQEILQVTGLQGDTAALHIKDVLPSAFDYLDGLLRRDRNVSGLPTGFVDLDRMITGLKPGDLFVLAARPAIGKTTLAMNIVRNVAMQTQVPVAVFSLEMGATQVIVRLICSEARVNLRDIRDGKLPEVDWHGTLVPAIDRLSKAPIYIDDTPQISSLELRQKVRRLKQDHHIGLVMIDYLQLMKPSGVSRNANREQEVARLSSDIKALAREAEVPIILLCQLNRQAEQAGSSPKLSHLRESGAIEQDADIVALLHREREVDTNRSPEEIAREGIPSQLILAKHRAGETGVANLLFFGQFTRFENASRFGDEDLPAGAAAPVRPPPPPAAPAEDEI